MDQGRLALFNTLAAQSGFSSLAAVSLLAPAAFIQRMQDQLAPDDALAMHASARQAHDELRLLEKRILVRSSPRLPEAVRLGLRYPDVSLDDYQEWFGGRAMAYVSQGSVASMFSPAAYLTELYRAACTLYPADSRWSIQSRRPDLAGLALSQFNMDTEVTALTLSNEILMSHGRDVLTAAGEEEVTDDAVMQVLATHDTSSATPWHYHHARLRQVRELQDPSFKHLLLSPAVTGQLSGPTRAGMYYDISPSLYVLLTEEVTAENAEALFAEHFGDIEPEMFLQPSQLRRWYDLTDEELRAFLVEARGEGSRYVDRTLNTWLGGQLLRLSYTHGASNPGSAINYMNIFPLSATEWRIEASRTAINPAGCFFVLYGEAFDESITVRDDAPVASNEPTIQVITNARGFPTYGSFTLQVGNADNGGASTANYNIQTLPAHAFALKLNKAIRLYKATGLAPRVLENLVNSVNPSQITDETLSLLFQSAVVTERYSIAHDDAIVLCAGLISVQGHNDQASQFDRLFNLPPLIEGGFYPDTTLQIDLRLDAVQTHSAIKAVLKRACHTDDAGLYALKLIMHLASPAATLPLKLIDLSRMYTLSLWARLHGLSPDELLRLLGMLGLPTNFYAKPTQDWLDLLTRLYATCQWLSARHWRVSDLELLTRDVSQLPSNAEIDGLRQSLADRLMATGSATWTLDEAIKLLAPVLSALFQLPGEAVGATLLRWADKAQPAALTVAQFCALLIELEPTADEQQNITAFCYNLAQMALIYHGSGATPDAMTLFVDKPESLAADAAETGGALKRSTAVVMALCDFSAWLKGLPGDAGVLLTALAGASGVTPEILAQACGIDPATVAQACSAAALPAALASHEQLQAAMQWLTLARTYNVMPSNLAQLLTLDYTAEPQALWGTWKTVADAFEAGLSPAQSTQLQRALSEGKSAALSGWLLAEHMPFQVLTGREALSDYLLSDNTNGAQVITSRIAEAMACLQAFVHRTLQAPESSAELDKTALSGEFFTNWARWNARYSTWAGGRKLIHYPENYIDPTVRLGQTPMMDNLLQNLGQAQVNTDTVGDAFLGYLSGFEEVANLETLSAYHDSFDHDNGKTWFIGRSQEARTGDDFAQAGQYWWRWVDEGKRGPEGKLPANAWSAWTRITCGPQPWGDCIRPVIYKKRLYVVWLEKQLKEPESETGTEATAAKWTFRLCVSYLRYDGGWSVPLVKVIEGAVTQVWADASVPHSLYLSDYETVNAVMITFYDRVKTGTNRVPTLALRLHENMTFSTVDTVIATAELRAVDVQLDTPLRQGCNYKYGMSFNAENTLKPFNSLGGVPAGFEKFEARITNVEVVADSVVPEEKYALRLSTNLTVDKNSNALTKLLSYYPELAEIVGPVKCLEWYDDVAVIHSSGTSYLIVREDISSWLSRMLWVNVIDPVPVHHVHFNDKNYVCAQFPHRVENLEWAEVIFTGNWLERHRIQFSLWWPSASEQSVEPASLQPIVPGEQVRRWHQKDDGSWMHFYKTSPLDLSAGEVTVSHSATTPTYDISAWEGKNERLHTIGFECGIGNRRNYTLRVFRTLEGELAADVLQTHGNGAQYLQHSAYRTRLNTLFARSLTEKAEAGIDSILAYDTQTDSREPQPGEGVYLEVGLPRYNAEDHGNSRATAIWLNNGNYCFWSGNLLDTEAQSIRVFAPYSWAVVNGIGFPSGAELKVFVTSKGVKPQLGTVKFTLDNTAYKVTGATFEAVATPPAGFTAQILDDNTEPMDFAGANALYFWELFYYTPMMVMQRFLQEQRFDQAEQWLDYVWQPGGYIVRGTHTPRMWNVRPLQDDQSWNSEPLLAYDPDAVAQNDPMHYKLNAFMRRLDILIGRGDAAYRRLQRDTLVEARVWYGQALRLLGEAPWEGAADSWSDPSLSAAASDTVQAAHLEALALLREGQVRDATRSAQVQETVRNASLFFPELNEQMQGYWQTLALRLYNLRHNLTLDGLPLMLPLYAHPADPNALLASAVAAEGGAGSELPQINDVPALRFQPLLESARGVVGQLIQFGSNLLQILERQDGEALSELLTTQGVELAKSSVEVQKQTLNELAAERAVLLRTQETARMRLSHYQVLYDEDINSRETQAMNLISSAQTFTSVAQGLFAAGAAISAVPNIFGLANGGHQPGQIPIAIGHGHLLIGEAQQVAGTRIAQEEAYRRRRQEWDVQRKQAECECAMVQTQLDALSVREESARMNIQHLTLQHSNAEAQLALFQDKFTGKALYSWLRGRLATVYFQYYDLAISRCMMAQKSLQWEKGDTTSYLRAGTWQGTRAGLMCGEGLLLALAQMDDAWLKWSQRGREITRTVSFNALYLEKRAEEDPATLADAIASVLASSGSEPVGPDELKLYITGGQLAIELNPSALNIASDFPMEGKRRVHSLAMTLPALLGPYQDIRAVLHSSDTSLPAGCRDVVISRGMLDSGTFPAEVDNGRWLPFGGRWFPFEGMDLSSQDTRLTLSFPDARTDQRALLESLTDAILHVHYTLRS